MSIRTLLVDDHKMLREGLRRLLEAEGDIEVVADAQEGRTAVRLAGELRPEIVVMDIAMPDLNGIDATRQIKLKLPDTMVVALSAHADRRTASAVLAAGASAFVPKDAAFEELVTAIRSAIARQIYISPRIAGDVVEQFLTNADGGANAAFKVLTAREREVLQLMSEGKATKEIAHHLHVSVKTIETHRRQVMEKLNLHSVAELTKYAIREGLTAL